MAERKFLTPSFGPLAGIRVMGVGSVVAMPSGANFLADLGAEFIQLERPGQGDVTTRNLKDIWHQDARNRLSLTLELDLHQPEIKEVFFELVKEVDILMENQVWLDKFGISVDEIMEANPQIVIVHVSGFGNERFGGDPNYLGRASYDIIGQAFSGYLSLNGTEEKPYVTKPYLNDYISAMWAVIGGLSALYHARQTGKGQIVDVTQYEAMARILAGEAGKAERLGQNPPRSFENNMIQPFGLYKTKDGAYSVVASASPGVFNRVLKATGIDPEKYTFQEVGMGVEQLASEKGQAFAKEFEEWCLAHTADEIDAVMAANKVPCSKVNTMQDILEHPHFVARNNWVEYENRQNGDVQHAFNTFPHFSETNGKVWRGAPDIGEDTETILKELLGFSDEKIQVLKDKKFI